MSLAIINGLLSAGPNGPAHLSPAERLRMVLLALALVCAYALPALAAADQSPVRSLLEMRQANVVTQQWDLSCGAAALTTVLNFQHGEHLTEREVAIGLMGREEYIATPDLVRIRQGFSLLDLKRFAERLGYRGIGLGQLEFQDLIDRAPLIIPVNLLGFNHFVVFRGVWADRVLVADPNFGNRTITREKFEQAWIDFEQLGHVGFVVERRDGLTPPNRLGASPADFVTFR